MHEDVFFNIKETWEHRLGKHIDKKRKRIDCNVLPDCQKKNARGISHEGQKQLKHEV